MDYVVERQHMISGQGVAVSNTYHRYVGKSGNTWLVADREDCGDYVYVTDSPQNNGKHGFGGAKLDLPLVEGGVFTLVGGWHSNVYSLFADTGVDVRDRHRTFVVIAESRAYGEHHETILKDVVYKDEEPTIGVFNRGELLAKELVEKLEKPLFMYSESQGGSSCFMVNPE